jgi:hypothetical protein
MRTHTYRRSVRQALTYRWVGLTCRSGWWWLRPSSWLVPPFDGFVTELGAGELIFSGTRIATVLGNTRAR